MELSNKQLNHIIEVLDKEGINYLTQTLSEWFSRESEKPIFISEEGLDLFIGDVYYVSQINIKREYSGTILPIKTEEPPKDPTINIIDTSKRFKFKHNAEKFVDLHKPKYSKKQVLAIVNNWSMTNISFDDIENYLHGR